MWTFTVPKLLRPFFLHRRELLGPLCRAAWETVDEFVAEAAGKEIPSSAQRRRLRRQWAQLIRRILRSRSALVRLRSANEDPLVPDRPSGGLQNPQAPRAQRSGLSTGPSRTRQPTSAGLLISDTSREHRSSVRRASSPARRTALVSGFPTSRNEPECPAALRRTHRERMFKPWYPRSGSLARAQPALGHQRSRHSE